MSKVSHCNSKVPVHNIKTNTHIQFEIQTSDANKVFLRSKPLDTPSEICIYHKIMRISAALVCRLFESWQPS